MKVFFKTFGCRVNQYETEGLREKLLKDGVTTAVADFETADLCVVNTCTVTNEADRDALKLLRRINRRNPAARVVVTGCLANRDAQVIRDTIPQALIVGNEDKDNIPALLGCRPAPDEAGIQGFANHSRAFIKVQDGCNMHCTYCIIPSVRPTLDSRPIDVVINEVRTLIASGYQELVFAGIRLGRYMVEDQGKRVDFVEMLRRVLSLEGNFRVRLSSFEVTDVTDRFLGLYDEFGDKLCPYLHLPLQSGSDKILKGMERWYSTKFYAKRIEALKKKVPGVGLFTDLMVGFPGEGEKEFIESQRFVAAMRFSGLHVFRYSKRDGTPAVDFPDQVSEAELVERSARMRAFDKELRGFFAAKAVGSDRQVLVEAKNASVEGVTDHFLRVTLDRNPGAGLHRVKIHPASQAVVID
jgi:threonylcarbamoyladenosine tRNA methylthiotransferase MtaB